MKAMKKLIPAMCMLLISAVLLGTSTYAWFSMNTQVSSTGMNVTAKSNAINLLIGDNAGIATTKDGLGTTIEGKYVTTGNDGKACYPVAYQATATTIAGTDVGAKSWYTASNGNTSAAADAITNVRTITEGDKDYMLTYKVWLTLSQDSEAVNNKSIKVTFSLTGEGKDVATSAVVKIGDPTTTTNIFALNSTNTTETTSAAVALANNTAVEVTIYVYIDGNSTNVYSDYINGENGKEIKGTVDLTFDLVDVPTAG